MYGNNTVFTNAGFSDTFTNAANANNDGYGGLYPFLTPSPSSSPNAFGEFERYTDDYHDFSILIFHK